MPEWVHWILDAAGFLLVLYLIWAFFYAAEAAQSAARSLTAMEQDVRETHTKLDSIESRLEAIEEHAKSINSAVSAAVRHWPDDYGILAEARRAAREPNSN